MAGYWDMHNHILPGVDDGSGSMAETLRLVQLEYDQGVRNIVFTPHYRKGMFEISLDEKEEVFHRTCETLTDHFPDMKFYLGCEYFASPHMVERVTKEPRYCMPNEHVILVEFSYTAEFDFIMQTVEKLQSAGMTPVIAHFERYQCLHEDYALVHYLAEEEVPLQMNCNAILGKEGFRMKRFCKMALKDGVVDLLASDAHNTTDRSVHIQETADLIRKKFGEDTVAELLQTNPQQLIKLN